MVSSYPLTDTDKSARHDETILITPGCATRHLPHKYLYIIPDYTEVITKTPHQYYYGPNHIPKVCSYNARARKLKVHDIMANHVTTITFPVKIPNPNLTHNNQ